MDEIEVYLTLPQLKSLIWAIDTQLRELQQDLSAKTSLDEVVNIEDLLLQTAPVSAVTAIVKAEIESLKDLRETLQDEVDSNE